MSSDQPETSSSPQERGKILHRRETRRQIWLPFALGILLVLVAFLVVGIPADPIWRVRAQAVSDFLYTLLCTIPILLCLFPLYLVIMLAIYGMNRLHNSTERPLRRVENMVEGLAKRIESGASIVNKQTVNLSTRIAPLLKLFSTFDPAQDESENKETTA